MRSEVSHAQNDLLPVQWLGQEVIRTENECTVASNRRRVTSEYDHRKLAQTFARAAQSAEDLEPVRVRHMQV